MIKITKCNINDANFVLNLYNFHVQNNIFFTKKKVRMHDHLTWMKYALKKPNYFYITYYKKKKIGYLRYERKSDKNYEISIAIKDKFQKKGLGEITFLKTRNKIKKFNIISKIKKNNKKSLKFFQKLGFKKYFTAKKYYVFKYKR